MLDFRVMEKKGHIATWLLLFGTLILIISAWFVYLSFDNNLGRNAQSLRESVAGVAEDSHYAEVIAPFIIKRALEEDSGGIKEISLFKGKIAEESGRVERVSSVKGNFFEKLRKGEFEINKISEEEYEFVMREFYVESKTGDNSVKRYFDLKFNFSRNVLVVR